MKMILKGLNRQILRNLTITYVGTLSDIYPVDGLMAASEENETGRNGFCFAVCRFGIRKSKAADINRYSGDISRVYSICDP